ncbi:MAG: hypothetical protein Kow0042_01610 [Calditrichia bacterium]
MKRCFGTNPARGLNAQSEPLFPGQKGERLEKKLKQQLKAFSMKSHNYKTAILLKHNLP